MATSPLNSNTDLPTFKILVNGTAVKDFYEIISVNIHKEINRINTAEVVLLDGSASDQTFEISESDDFVPGGKVEISLGYHSKEQTAFKGIITSQQIKVRSSVGGVQSVLTVECMDEVAKLTVGRKSKTFKEKKDSDAITSIVAEAALDKSVEATTLQHKQIVQYDSTDWDFILARAEINGMVVICEDGKLNVSKPTFSAPTDLLLTYGKDVFDFQAELDSRSQLASVECKAWDGKTQALISGQSSEPSVNAQGNLTGKKLSSVVGPNSFLMTTTAPLIADELKSWASAKLQKSRMAKVKGRVTFPGSTLAKLGGVVKLEGFGARFNGDAYISRVIHTVEKGTWQTTIGFGLSEKWFAESQRMESPPAAGLLPGIAGLQVGVVKQIDQDPDGESRVLVTIPVIEESGDGVWARLSNLYASSGIGSYFYPEVGDEVVLGFLNEDPRYPVILGSMFSSKLAPPYTPEAENKTKGITTKSKMKLTFDEENKVVTIETPGGNKVTLSDKDKSIVMEDQNKNKIEMGDGGITLDSPKDIKITTKGNFNVEATSGVTIKATGDAAVTGNNVNLKANIGLTAEGSATAALKASGQVEVKGAMVMIN